MDRARFELAASSMPRRRSTELIYLPMVVGMTAYH